MARIVEAEGCKAEDKGKGNLNLQAPPAGRGRRGGVHVRILGKGCVNYFSKSNKAWLTALLPAPLSLRVARPCVCVCVPPRWRSVAMLFERAAAVPTTGL